MRDGGCVYCNGHGSVNACEYLTRNVIRIQCAACGGSGLRADMEKHLAELQQRLVDDEKAAWARRLNAIADKHERPIQGVDEATLADWGRTS